MKSHTESLQSIITLAPRVLFATALSGVLIAQAATGQSSDKNGSEVYELDEIVVTSTQLYSDQVNALRTPTPIIDVPQSLSILTAEQLAVQGIDRIGDIIDYIPGVNTSQGEGHRDAVVFRGVRSTADFFVDGVRDDVQYYRPLYNVQQLEVLRGPNALLFGRGGSGGVINRVLKKAEIGSTFTDYQVSVDTFGAFGGQLDNNLAINDKAALRTNLYYESWDNHRDFFDGDLYGVNPTVRFQLAEDTTLDVSYEYLNQDHFIDRGIPTGTNGEPVEALNDIVFGDPELNYSLLEAHTVRANLQHKFSEMLKGNLTAFYGDYEKTYSNFYASGYNQAVSPNQVTLDGYIDSTFRQNFVLSGNLVGELDTAGIGHTIILGAEYIGTQSDQNRFNPVWTQTNDDNEVFDISRPLNLISGRGVNASGNPTIANFTQLNDFTQVDIDVFSAYIQDEIAVTDWLDIVLGGRFDSFDYSVNDIKNNDFVTRQDQILTPRAGIIFKPFEAISFYGSYSETFLPASGEQFSDLNRGGTNNDTLAPDRFQNLEAGVKWNIKPNLSLTAAMFEIEQRQPQTADANPATLDVIESNISGFELQLQGKITDKWFISGGYSFLDGDVVNQFGNKNGRPRELPENMFSLWNHYKATPKLGVGLGFIYQDESFITDENVGGITPTLPSYVRLDGAVFYDVKENLRIQLNVENLTDETYYPNAHSTYQATVGAPINARLTVSGRF